MDDNDPLIKIFNDVADRLSKFLYGDFAVQYQHEVLPENPERWSKGRKRSFELQ